jgi:hypothetical protein
MMILKHVMGLVGGCTVLGAVTTGANAQVWARAEATALVRFLEVRETTNGTPIGGSGLNYHRWLQGSGAGAFQPWTSLHGISGGLSGPPIAGAGPNAPLPNTGASSGNMFDVRAFPNGFGTTGTIGSDTINYTNTTGGHSEYEIDGELVMSLSFWSDLTDPARENVIVWGQIIATILDEDGISLVESEQLMISGANASGSVTSRAYPFTMRIGNISGGFRKDLAEIHFEYKLIASIRSVPAPGALVFVPMAGVLATRRRR